MTEDSSSPSFSADELEQFVSENKIRRFDEILAERTRHFTLVLEDIHSTHNASACLRTCDCFGLQDVYTIENRNSFEPHEDITVGSAQWVNVIRYAQPEAENTRDCLAALKAAGYRIIAATPHGDACTPNDGPKPSGQQNRLLDRPDCGDANRVLGCTLAELDVEPRTALLFGAELAGLSPAAQELADGFVTIPMFGFTESFNISVAVAICLHEMVHKLRRTDVDWHLTDGEKETIRTEWIRQVVNKRMPPDRAEQFWKELEQRVGERGECR